MGILSRRLAKVSQENQELMKLKKTEHIKKRIKLNHKIINNLKEWIYQDTARLSFAFFSDYVKEQNESLRDLVPTQQQFKPTAIQFLMDALNTPEFVDAEVDEVDQTFIVIAKIMEDYKNQYSPIHIEDNPKGVGLEDGDLCNRNGCIGIINIETDYSCSCHMGNPPCGVCTTPNVTCSDCDYEDFQQN